MWFILAIGLWHNLRSGEVTSGKWRIPYGNSESDLFSYSKLRRVQVRLASKDLVLYDVQQRH
jgi:hypothetical protein